MGFANTLLHDYPVFMGFQSALYNAIHVYARFKPNSSDQWIWVLPRNVAPRIIVRAPKPANDAVM